MATLYWYGGTGNWSSATGHWSTNSGNTPNADHVAPTSTDDVVFDSLSNATAYTVTVDATSNCANLTMGAPLAGKVTWAGSFNINVYGSLNLSGGTAGITNSFGGYINFTSTTTGKTITTNGVSIQGFVFNGVGGGWTLQDNLTQAGLDGSLQNGALDTNGKTVTAQSFYIVAGTKSLTLGSSIINISTQFQVISVTGLTFSVGTSSFVLTTTSLFSGGGLTYNDVQFNGTSHTVSGTNTFATLTRTGTATKTDSITFANNQTITGTLTITGNSVTNRIIVQSDVKGTARTLSAATVTVTNTDFQDITGAGSGSWNLSAITGLSGDCGGNSGITFTTPVTTNYTGGTGSFSTVASWSSRVPLPQDTATFTTAGTNTITQDMPRIGSIDFTGSSNKTWTTTTACSIFGGINLTDLTTLSASSQAYIFEGRGSNTLTSAGKSWAKSITLNMAGGTLILGDDFTNGGALDIILTSGIFNINGKSVTIRTFNSSGLTTRSIIFGNSNVSIKGSWTCTTATNLTITPGTSTITMVNNGASCSFAGGGRTYYNFYNNTSGASVCTISGNNTFNDFNINIGRSTLFTAGSTTTVTTFPCTGSSGNLITLNSTTTGTFTLTAPSRNNASPISCDYLNIQHCIATQANTWYAGVNSVNNQATATAGSGWIFTAPVVVSGNNGAGFFLMI